MSIPVSGGLLVAHDEGSPEGHRAFPDGPLEERRKKEQRELEDSISITEQEKEQAGKVMQREIAQKLDETEEERNKELNEIVRDVYAEMLCSPDGSDPTVDSLHYEYEDECIAFEIFNAGTLNGTPLVYPVSVHGPMIGTATL